MQRESYPAGAPKPQGRDSVASVFLAYPSNPESLGQPLEAAARSLNAAVPDTIETWRALGPDGSFISTNVTQAILESRSFAADVTVPNFNVFYEIGYAIGLAKHVLILRNRALARSKQLTELGLFDTLGYREYENSKELVSLLCADDWGLPLAVASRPLNQKAPVYLLGAKYKTDFAIRISSRLKKARLNYRTFDPSEQARLSAFEAIGEVSQSLGVLVHLIPSEVQDSVDHNLRGAFLSGLAEGLGRVYTILQQCYDPVPLDCRDPPPHRLDGLLPPCGSSGALRSRPDRRSHPAAPARHHISAKEAQASHRQLAAQPAGAGCAGARRRLRRAPLAVGAEHHALSAQGDEHLLVRPAGARAPCATVAPVGRAAAGSHRPDAAGADAGIAVGAS
jgi:hypothetical protein